MREVANITNNKDADRFASFLVKEGIDAISRPSDSTYSVWVIDEDDVKKAQDFYALFKKNPEDKRFSVGHVAMFKQKNDGVNFNQGQMQKDRSRVVDVRREVFNQGSDMVGTITIGMIIVSVIATFALDLPAYKWLKYKFYFSEYMGNSFREILSGQIWRIFTPIFLHGGFMHLIFNMMWLYQLGGQIEKREGQKFYILFVLLIAAFANTGQYLWSGPAFVGMSGVVYGLLGFIWMMDRYKYNSGYMLSSGTVGFMVIWMVICMLGIIGNVANAEHVLGFIGGTAWGFFRSGGLTAELRRKRMKMK